MLNNIIALEFIENLKINKKSENTIRIYRNNLKIFFEVMEELRPDIKIYDIYGLDKLTVDDINKLKIHMEEVKGKKRTYINSVVATISSFFTYLRKIYIDICLVKNIGKMAGKMVEHKPQSVFLEVEESKKLLETASKKTKSKNKIKKGGKDNSIRNELMINLFLNCGLRCKELCELEFKNIIEEDNYIRFFGKGKKERGLYVTDKTMELYRAWLEERTKLLSVQRAKEGHENKIFISRKRQAITVKQVNRILDEYCNEAGIDKHITSHKLRHTVATAFLKEGNRSLQEVADILGHSSTETTKRYSHITDDNKKLTRTSNPIFG